jgi:hypothetical protein
MHSLYNIKYVSWNLATHYLCYFNSWKLLAYEEQLRTVDLIFGPFASYVGTSVHLLQTFFVTGKVFQVITSQCTQV